VKFETAPAFVRDLRRLTREELELFKKVVREEFVPAAERVAATRSRRWPKGLRVGSVKGARIWEMTWSFAGPDGRATFEWVEIDGEPAIRWRRVGGHEIFEEPAREAPEAG
jgi:hypothetical protein